LPKPRIMSVAGYHVTIKKQLVPVADEISA